MLRTGTIWPRKTLTLLIICGTALWMTGCRSPRLGKLPGIKRLPSAKNLPGIKRLSWVRDRESKTGAQVAANSSSATLPSASVTPSAPTTSPSSTVPPTTNYAQGHAGLNPNHPGSAGGNLASNPQFSAPNVSNMQYPRTARPEVTYSGQAAGGYYTGGYGNRSSVATYNSEPPQTQLSGGSATYGAPQAGIPQAGIPQAGTPHAAPQAGTPQNGFYSAGPPPQANPQANVYTADVRSARPANTSDVYGTPPPQNNQFSVPPNNQNGLPASNPYPNQPTGYGGNDSRYTVPPAAPPAASSSYTNPAPSTPYGPGVSAPPIPGNESLAPGTAAPAAYVPQTVPHPNHAVTHPGSPTSQPWRPGSTRNYVPAGPQANGDSSGSQGRNSVGPASFVIPPLRGRSK